MLFVIGFIIIAFSALLFNSLRFSKRYRTLEKFSKLAHQFVLICNGGKEYLLHFSLVLLNILSMRTVFRIYCK